MFAQDTIVDRKYEIHYGSIPNIESGSQSAIGLSSLLFDQLNLTIKNNIKSKGLNFAARLGNFSLIQFYIGSQIFATIPHEYSGHYSMARVYGIDSEFKSNFPGMGGSTTLIMKQSIPSLQRQMIMAGGPEVTADIAYKATQELYSDDYVPNYIGNYLLAGKLIDEFIYLQNNVKPFLADPNKYTKDNQEDFKVNPVANDPLSYVLALTESYGYYDNFINKNAVWLEQFPDMTVYTQNVFIKDQYKRMKTAYLLTALDPSNLYFLYGNALYLAKGKTYFKPFMLHLGNVYLMPSVRANMGEIGIENYFDMFFKIKNSAPFSVYYRDGGNMFDQLKGFGGEIRNINLCDRVSMNGQVDYWYNERSEKNNFNISSCFKLSDKKHLFSFLGTIGYKTKGNLMGKPFNEGLFGYIGLGLNLKYKQKASR